jgi:peptide chain release factor 2
LEGLINQASTQEDWDYLEEECQNMGYSLLPEESSQEYHGTILTIRSGAGGKEARAWAYMVARMYYRHFQKSGIAADLMEWSEEESGLLREASLLVHVAFERLSGEAGPHRLTRFSPFCAENKPHTSFALVSVEEEPDEKSDLVLPPQDIRVDVFRAQGPGGQGVNTTDSAVRLTHLPTGIRAVCQATRSQQKNKAQALKILTQRVEEEDAQKKERVSGKKSTTRSYSLIGTARVKDHRTQKSDSRPLHVLEGNLSKFLGDSR